MKYLGNGMVLVNEKSNTVYARTKSRAAGELLTALESYKKLFEGTDNPSLKDLYRDKGYDVLCALERSEHHLGEDKLKEYVKIFCPEASMEL